MTALYLDNDAQLDANDNLAHAGEMLRRLGADEETTFEVMEVLEDRHDLADMARCEVERFVECQLEGLGVAWDRAGPCW